MKLFTQIWNERKHNFWLWLELFVVSAILWFVVDTLYVSLSCLYEPRGHHIDHTYHITYENIDSVSSNYVNPQVSGLSDGKSMLEIISRLRNHPDIESICLSMASHPYCPSNRHSQYTYKGYGNIFFVRSVTPEFMKVFRCEGINGETPEQLMEILESKQVLISTGFFPDSLANDQFINQEIIDEGDKNAYVIGATIVNPKLMDYRYNFLDAFYHAVTEEDILKGYNTSGWWDLNIRVKDNCSSDFAQRLFADADHYQVGNLLMTGIQSMEDIREMYQTNDFNKFFNELGIIAFLLVNIFFGVLGTFWFRTQQRRHEIALLRAIGSSQKQIYKRMIGEGLIILTAGSVCAWVVDAFIAHAGINSDFYGETLSLERFATTIGFTLLCMAIMVAVGIMIPARKAQQIEISTALHEE